MAARVAGLPADEMAGLLAEIAKLGGKTQQVSPGGLPDAIAALVRDEGIRKADAVADGGAQGARRGSTSCGTWA